MPTLAQIRENPHAHLLCTHAVNTACADRAAAKRVGHVVAWIPVSKSQPLANLLVLDAGYAIENLKLGSNDVQIASPALPIRQGDEIKSVPTTIHWGSDSGVLRQENNPGLALSTITWTHLGSPVKLTLIGDLISVGEAQRIAGLVRYSTTSGAR